MTHQKYLKTKGLGLNQCAVKMLSLFKYFDEEINTLVDKAFAETIVDICSKSLLWLLINTFVM
jgi:hypothetical protein